MGVAWYDYGGCGLGALGGLGLDFGSFDFGWLVCVDLRLRLFGALVVLTCLGRSCVVSWVFRACVGWYNIVLQCWVVGRLGLCVWTYVLWLVLGCWVLRGVLDFRVFGVWAWF